MVWRSGHRGQDRGREARVAEPFDPSPCGHLDLPRPLLWVSLWTWGGWFWKLFTGLDSRWI